MLPGYRAHSRPLRCPDSESCRCRPGAHNSRSNRSRWERAAGRPRGTPPVAPAPLPRNRGPSATDRRRTALRRSADNQAPRTARRTGDSTRSDRCPAPHHRRSSSPAGKRRWDWQARCSALARRRRKGPGTQDPERRCVHLRRCRCSRRTRKAGRDKPSERRALLPRSVLARDRPRKLRRRCPRKLRRRCPQAAPRHRYRPALFVRKPRKQPRPRARQAMVGFFVSRSALELTLERRARKRLAERFGAALCLGTAAEASQGLDREHFALLHEHAARKARGMLGRFL